jgi:Flp pilus assembly protein TadD
MGDHDAAQAIYRRALARYPNDPSLRSNYALSQRLSAQAGRAQPASPKPMPAAASGQISPTAGLAHPGKATMDPIPY